MAAEAATQANFGVSWRSDRMKVGWDN